MIGTLDFNTDPLPAEDKFAAFRAGATHFEVTTVGDPLDFSARWRLLKLGDLNAIHSHAKPMQYRRSKAMIAADGEDRIAIHYYVSGGSVGELDERPTEVAAGGAVVWDLARPIVARATGPVEMLIVTMPRYMLDEVLSVPCYSAVLPPSPELALAADQLRYLIDHAADLPTESGPYLGRALRDLFAVAMLPVLKSSGDVEDRTSAPLFRRLCEYIDANVDKALDEALISDGIGDPIEEIRRTVDHFGGLPLLIERRRLLAAYRLLCNPAEDSPVSAIAWRCGFTDASSFSRRFRRVFHTRPSDLRQFRQGYLPRWAGAYHVEKNYGALVSSAPSA